MIEVDGEFWGTADEVVGATGLSKRTVQRYAASDAVQCMAGLLNVADVVREEKSRRKRRAQGRPRRGAATGPLEPKEER
ncbi:MAG: hypothetical protein K0S37_2392 [Microbacterium sp.]|nr:hypothetical protein [Microbacterium sp.]